MRAPAAGGGNREPGISAAVEKCEDQREPDAFFGHRKAEAVCRRLTQGGRLRGLPFNFGPLSWGKRSDQGIAPYAGDETRTAMAVPARDKSNSEFLIPNFAFLQVLFDQMLEALGDDGADMIV